MVVTNFILSKRQDCVRTYVTDMGGMSRARAEHEQSERAEHEQSERAEHEQSMSRA